MGVGLFIIIYSLALSQTNQNLLKRVEQQIDDGYQNIDRPHVERTYHHNAYRIRDNEKVLTLSLPQLPYQS